MSEKPFAISDVLPGKLNALVKNLMFQMQVDDSNEAVRRINAGEWIAIKRDWIFRMWGWVTHNAFKHVSEMSVALKKANCAVTSKAESLLQTIQYTVFPERKVELVYLRITELGFSDEEDLTLQEVYARARVRGLDHCPAQIGPLAAIFLGKDLVGSETFMIAMQPIEHQVFMVQRLAGDLYLGVYDVSQNRKHPQNEMWVFIRRQVVED